VAILASTRTYFYLIFIQFFGACPKNIGTSINFGLYYFNQGRMRLATQTIRSVRCEIRDGLAQDFATAARLYAEAVVVLTISSATTSANQYDRLCQAVEEARRHSEAIGIVFQEHVNLHQCVANIPLPPRDYLSEQQIVA
jgi:hypothetical protein